MVTWRCAKLQGGHYPKYEPLKRTSSHRKKKERNNKLSTACIHGTESLSVVMMMRRMMKKTSPLSFAFPSHGDSCSCLNMAAGLLPAVQ